MADREKVFDALRNCVTEPKCKDCPWEDCEKIGCKRTKVPVTLLLDTLNLLKEQLPQWISVKDRMPPELHSMWFPLYGTPKWRNVMWREESDLVLVAVVFDDGTRYVSMGRTHDGEWNTNISKVVHNTVTHWMPLPEPPEGGKPNENTL